MNALISLGVIVSVFVAWCVYDFTVSIRLWPGQHTASMYLRRWIKAKSWHKIAVAFVLVDGALYLILHLVLQVV